MQTPKKFNAHSKRKKIPINKMPTNELPTVERKMPTDSQKRPVKQLHAPTEESFALNKIYPIRIHPQSRIQHPKSMPRDPNTITINPKRNFQKP
jgi:hypothetical protein